MTETLLDPTAGYARSHHGGLWLPERIAKRPTAVDLFCGCGGMSLGFIQAGWEVVAGVDSDPDCMLTYLYNLGAEPCEIHYVTPEDRARAEKAAGREHRTQARRGEEGFDLTTRNPSRPELPGVGHFWLGDARLIKGQDILDALGLEVGEIDCVCGGPPCQGFSIAGKREVMDPRNSLVFEFARLVLEMRPKTLLFENVPGILSMVTPEGLPVVDELCRVLEDGGFGTVDALKRSLLSTSGAGAALLSQPTEKRKAQPVPAHELAPTLFDEVAP